MALNRVTARANHSAFRGLRWEWGRNHTVSSPPPINGLRWGAFKAARLWKVKVAVHLTLSVRLSGQTHFWECSQPSVPAPRLNRHLTPLPGTLFSRGEKPRPKQSTHPVRTARRCWRTRCRCSVLAAAQIQHYWSAKEQRQLTHAGVGPRATTDRPQFTPKMSLARPASPVKRFISPNTKNLYRTQDFKLHLNFASKRI